MSDRILDKYLHRKPEEHTGADPGSRVDSAEADAADDLGCFGYLRGVRDRSIMLELRKADGTIMAIGYSWLERVEFDPAEGITLHLHGRTVRIKGRNLNAEIRPQVRLFHGIVRHRVPWVRQAEDLELMKTGDKETVVETVQW